jgi:HEXXH motif-containing protein
MYALLGYHECLEIVRRAAASPAPPVSAAGDLAALGRAYRGRLAGVQPAFACGDGGPGITFVQAPEHERELIGLFLDPGGDAASVARIVGRLVGPRDAAAVARVMGDARDALAHIRSASPELGGLIELAITTIFRADLTGVTSGSVKEAIGVVLLNPPAAASVYDVAEILVHEFAHSLGYADESTAFYFRDETVASEFMAVSAIRSKPRPVYYVLHSMIAACEILNLRALLPVAYEPAIHPPADRLRESCRRALASVEAVASGDLFTPRGERLYEAIRAFVNAPAHGRGGLRAGVR